MAEVYEIEKTANADFVKCKTCGGNMTFDPDRQMLTCAYCGETQDFAVNKHVKELAIEEGFNAAARWDNTAVLRCDNCGAKIVMSVSDVAKGCPYCGTSHIRQTEELPGIKPNAVYPFTVSLDKAEVLAKKWAGKKFYAPTKFKKNMTAENIKGVYEPCFTFDSETVSTYKGKIGKRKTRTVKTADGETKTETYIEWHFVSGCISKSFDDITISASSTFEQKTLDKLMPYDIDTIAVYNKDYLAGFSANHYKKDLRTAWGDARDIMKVKIRNAILARYDCDEVEYLDVSTEYDDVTYKYVLMPVYILNYQYKKKNYAVNINGNTGKVCGKTPVSPWRVLITVLVIAGIVGLFMLLGYLDSEEILAIDSIMPL